MSLTDLIVRHVPLPKRVALHAAGLHITDHAISFIDFVSTKNGLRVGRYGIEKIPDGIIVRGVIVRHAELAVILAGLRKRYRLKSVRASLPSEIGHLFTTRVPVTSNEETKEIVFFKLEEYVPLDPNTLVVDFDPITEPSSTDHTTVVVSAVSRTYVEDYSAVFHKAGIELLSLEFDGQAISQAVIPHHETSGALVVDMGTFRTGISIVGGGTVRFAVAFPNDPVDVSGIREQIVHPLTSELPAAFEEYARETTQKIEQQYLQWETRKNPSELHLPKHSIKKIVLAGDYAFIPGLPEYVTRNLRVPTMRADVWTNAFSPNDYIPPISYDESLKYAAAIGMALRRDV